MSAVSKSVIRLMRDPRPAPRAYALESRPCPAPPSSASTSGRRAARACSSTSTGGCSPPASSSTPSSARVPACSRWTDRCGGTSSSRSRAACSPSSAADVQAVGVSGMGPCVLLTDEADEPLRPAILYGVDTRSGRQIERLNDRYGAEEIQRRGGSAAVLAGGGGQGRVGRRRRAGAVRAGAPAVHAELVPRPPADRRVRPGPPLREPVHAALRLGGAGLAPSRGRTRSPAASSSRRCGGRATRPGR